MPLGDYLDAEMVDGAGFENEFELELSGFLNLQLQISSFNPSLFSSPSDAVNSTSL